MSQTKPQRARLLDRLLIGALIFFVLLLIGLQAVRAAESVPPVDSLGAAGAGSVASIPAGSAPGATQSPAETAAAPAR